MGTLEAGIGEAKENEGWGAVYITGPGLNPILVGGDIRGLGAMNTPWRKWNKTFREVLL